MLEWALNSKNMYVCSCFSMINALRNEVWILGE
jgi:hypothetical protein